MRTVSGTGEATIEDVTMVSDEGGRLDTVYVGQSVKIRVTVRVNQDIDSLVLGYGIKDRLGQLQFGTNTFHTNQVLTNLKSGQVFCYSISFVLNLGVGTYSVQTAAVRNNSHIEKNYHWIDRAFVFEVINKDKAHFSGCSWNEVVFDVSEMSR